MQDNRSRLSSWELDRDNDDIRGWPVQDLNGNPRGKVDKLFVDTDSQFITELVLEDGTRIPAHDLVIGDRTLILQSGARAVTKEATLKEATQKAAPREKARETKPAPMPKPTVRRTDGEDVVLQLADEELEIGKRKVSSGGVHLETHVVAEPFTQEVPLRSESLKVERSAVDRPLNADEADRYLRDQTVEMFAKSEVPIVDKRAHVVEEIVLKKTAAEHVERVRDTVRHTEADVIQLPADAALQGGRR